MRTRTLVSPFKGKRLSWMAVAALLQKKELDFGGAASPKSQAFPQ